MSRMFLSRRVVLTASPYALAASLVVPTLASARAKTGLDSHNRDTIRKWYEGWETKDWPPLDRLLTDDFTFTSAAGDDHISKATFKTRCWESQIDFIGRFELRHVFGHGNEAFVMYVCQTKNGKSFRNVEYLRLRGDKIEAIECYFGSQSSFPSAVSAAER
jgi:ketosteroid isomerase-like protein